MTGLHEFVGNRERLPSKPPGTEPWPLRRAGNSILPTIARPGHPSGLHL